MSRSECSSLRWGGSIRISRLARPSVELCHWRRHYARLSSIVLVFIEYASDPRSVSSAAGTSSIRLRCHDPSGAFVLRALGFVMLKLVNDPANAGNEQGQGAPCIGCRALALKRARVSAVVSKIRSHRREREEDHDRYYEIETDHGDSPNPIGSSNLSSAVVAREGRGRSHGGMSGSTAGAGSRT